MKLLVGYLVLTIVVFTSGAQLEGSASVSGFVTRLSTAERISNASVTLTSESGRTISTKTDSVGRFEFKAPPGKYVLDVTRTGFVRPAKSAGTIRLTLEPAEQLKDLNISLDVAATLTGRVVDENEIPSVKATVLLLRPLYKDGHRQLDVCSASDMRLITKTDGNGTFRLTDVPPGEYYLAASTTWCSAPVYYFPGGVSDPADAVMVSVNGPDQVFNLSLSKRASYTVRFKLRPVPPPGRDAYLLLTRLGRNQMQATELELAGYLSTDLDGNYQLSNISRGDYDLWFTTNSHSVSRVHLTFSVTDRDLDLGTIPIPPLVSLSGSISSGAGVSNAVVSRSRTITLRPAEGRMASLTTPQNFRVPVTAEGKFTYSDIPQGQYRIVVSGFPADTYLSSIRYGQTDVTDTVLQLTGEGTLTLTLDGPAGSVDGVVTRATGRPVANAQIVLVPGEKRRGNSTLFKQTTSDQNGTFHISGIPAGEYGLLAWEELESGAQMNEELLKSVENMATRVTVSRGSTSNVGVRVISSQR